MQAHVAILVGPSLGTAKSRVILGIDGLETRIWGAREDGGAKNAGADQESDEGEEEGSSADESDESAEEPEGSDDDDDEDEDEAGDDSAEGDDDGEEEESAHFDDGKPAASPPASPPPPSYTSYADEQRFLQTSDRLLSRTLAAADADGRGISSEMSACAIPFPPVGLYCAHCSHNHLILSLLLQLQRRRTSSSAPRAASLTPRGSRGRASAPAWTARCASSWTSPDWG